MTKKIIYIMFAVVFVAIVLFFEASLKHETELINKSIEGLQVDLTRANVSESIRESISQDYISYLENAETTLRIKDFFIFSICIISLLIFIIIIENLVDVMEKKPSVTDSCDILTSTGNTTTHRGVIHHKKRYYRNYKIKKK